MRPFMVADKITWYMDGRQPHRPTGRHECRPYGVRCLVGAQFYCALRGGNKGRMLYHLISLNTINIATRLSPYDQAYNAGF